MSASVPSPDRVVSVRWTGAAGLEFTHNGKTWLIDPYLSRVGKATVFFGRPEADREKIFRYLDALPGKLQAVIVGHTHLDHALDVPEIIGKLPVSLIGNESLETLMALHGIPGQVAVCTGNTRVDLPGGAVVTMIPSLHGLVLFGRAPYAGEIAPGQKPPLKASRYRHGRVFNIRIEVGGKSFLHVGTANLIDGELEGQTCDVLFLCMPGWKMIPNYHGRILSRVRPRIVVPFHFDDFSAPLSNDGRTPSVPGRSGKRFLERIAEEAPDARIVRPDLFQPLLF
jgi:L-ascorbate metabolism protein UlaG (beta-lactamase superfamily)